MTQNFAPIPESFKTQNFLGSKKNFVPKRFLSQKNLGPEKIWSQKNLKPEENYGPKIIWVLKKCGSLKYSRLERICV